jgi:hypothetical protein
VPNADPDGFGHGIGDIMELEVKKNLLAQSPDLLEERGPLGGEEFQPDLEDTGFGQLSDEIQSLFLIFDIEGDDNPSAGSEVWAHDP